MRLVRKNISYVGNFIETYQVWRNIIFIKNIQSYYN